MATANMSMECVKKGGKRQELYELIRIYSNDAIKNCKENDGNSSDKSEKLLIIGRAPEQVTNYINKIIDPS